MNPIVILKAMQIIQEVIKNLPEEVKRKIDAEIDKVEDKFKQGSLLDTFMEQTMMVVRGQIGVPDFTDEKDRA